MNAEQDRDSEATANSAAVDAVLRDAEAAAAAGATREARALTLAPADMTPDQLRGWKRARAPWGDTLEYVRAFRPPDLHSEAARAFDTWAERADRRLSIGEATAEGLRGEYVGALADAAKRDREFQSRDAAAVAARREDFIMTNVPSDYRKPIDRANPEHRRVNWPAFDAVQAWRPGGERPGLLLCGDTGLGKTLSVFSRLAALHRAEGITFIALSSDMLKQRILDLSRNVGRDDDEALSGFCERLQSVPILFIDDLGQAKMSGLFAEKLFSIVERRRAEMLPIVVTVQLRPPELVRKLSGWETAYYDTARCLVYRLCSVCEAVDFGFPDDGSAAD